jgi:hypothetical protein
MFHRFKVAALAPLLAACVGMMHPGAALARGGGGGGGGGGRGGGFGGGGFRGGGFGGSMSGFRSGGFSRGSNSGFSGFRGTGGNLNPSFRGTQGNFSHVPAAPTTGRWNNFGRFNNGRFNNGRFNHFNRFRNRFFFGGFWGLGDWWYDDSPPIEEAFGGWQALRMTEEDLEHRLEYCLD